MLQLILSLQLFIVFIMAASEETESVTERIAPVERNDVEVTHQILESVMNHTAWHDLDLGDEMNCGESNSDRIIGGTDAALGQYPWIARLGYEEEEKPGVTEYKCGGSLLNKLYVLTAAHCVTPKAPTVVMLGEYDARTEIDCSNGECADAPQKIRIESISTHESYDDPKFSNDMAMIRLAESAKLSDWVRPICLPKLGIELDYSSSAETAGWGITNVDTLDVADILQTLSVPLVSLDKCQKFYKGIANLTQKQLCAGGIIDKDACGGDSGGPLMQARMGDDGPQYYLMGVVSFGPAMCGSVPPGVFSNTVRYLKWILDHVKP